jgi:hypothetical protein
MGLHTHIPLPDFDKHDDYQGAYDSQPWPPKLERAFPFSPDGPVGSKK